MPIKLKSFYCATVLALMFLSASAQQFLNYQAIAWNANRIPKANQTVTVQINIRSSSITATPEYTEAFTVTTNEFGYFNLEIGSSRIAEFKQIDWSKRPKFLEVKVDGVFIENSEMPSVPYAIYAEQVNLKAGAGISIQGNEISNTQKLEINNDILKLAPGGNEVVLPKDTVGAYESVAPLYLGNVTLGTVFITSSTPVGHFALLSIPISSSNEGPYLILANVERSKGTYYISVINKAGTRIQLSSFNVSPAGVVQNWQMFTVQAGSTVVLGRDIEQEEIPTPGSGKPNRLAITAKLGIVKLF